MKHNPKLLIALLFLIGIVASSQTAQAQCSLINYSLDVSNINYSDGDCFGCGDPDPRIGVEIVSGMTPPIPGYIAMSCGVEANPATGNTTLSDVFAAVTGCGVGLAPASVGINISGFEEDGCGGDCSYDTGCFNDDDDLFTGISRTFNIPKSGNCLVSNPTIVTQNYTGGFWNVTVRLIASYSINPPIAQGATAFACGTMPTVQVTSLVTGTTYEWFSDAAGTIPGSGIAGGTGNGSYTPSPAEVNMNAVGDYYVYVRAVHACDANVKSTPTPVLVKVIAPCPELATATFSPVGNVCQQQSVALALTVSNPNLACPTTFVEGTDYLVIWRRNGTIIKDGRGADGNPGTADDVTNLSNTAYIVPYDAAASCGSQDNSFDAEIICLKSSGPITAGGLNQYCSSTLKGQYGGYGSSTLNGYTNGCPGVGGSQGPANMVDYFNPCNGQFNNTQFQNQGAPFDIALNLSYLPTCAQVSQVTYQLQGTSSSGCNSNYTSSWASEANFVFYTPAATPGNANAAGTFSWSNAGYTNCTAGSPDCNQSGGDFNFSNSIIYGPGITASGNWQLLFWDDYNDGGTLPDGEVNYYYLNVAYYYPPGCLPNTTLIATEAGGTATVLKVWDIPDAGTDFVAPTAGSSCSNDVVINCPTMEVLYANAAAGPYTLTAPPIGASTIYYRVRYTDATAPACAVATSSFANVDLPPPSAVGNNSVCQGASSVPVANQLTATCAACAVPACTDVCAPCATGAPTSTTISLGSNSEDYFGYCELCGACSTLPGGDACGDNPSTTPDFGCGGGSVNTFNVTVSTPPSTIPPCATLNYTITGDFTSINGSFAGELFVRITPPGGSPTVYNPGAGVCSGTNQTFTIASGPGTPTAGSWLIEMSDVYNDSDSGADGNLAVNVNVVYTVPTLPPPPPPVPADITWYDAPTGGTVQGTGSPFDPFGKIAEEGPVDLNLPGNYTFYTTCGCGDCESTRTPVIFTVIPKAAGPSVDDEELCIGGTVPTITPIGSAIGSLFNIYALGTTIPLNAAPQGQFTSANLVSYGFNPGVVGETTYLVTEITDPTGLACESNPTAFSITVNPAPTPTASNSGPYCEGETIEVSATGGFFYNWSGPGGYAASGSPAFRFDADPTMAGTYNVTVTNLQGCTAATNTTVVVNANPGPPTVTANDACINTALTAADFLSASCSGTITWWNSPVGGTQQGTGTTLDPTGKVALQGAFSIATPGVYTFFAQCADATTGCLSTRQPVSFTVYPSPIPAAFNNGPICSGQSVTITATGGASYSWSNGATTASATVSPTTTTPYTVTVTSSNGCTATASTTVVVYPNPTATIAALTYTVCEDGTVVIDGGASGGTALYTYVWGGAGAPFLVNATLSDPLFDASLTVPGSYPLTLQIIDANGCSSTVASTTVNVVGGGAPVISCPANVLLSTDNGLCTTQYQPTAPTTNNGCYGDLILTYALTGVTTGSGTGAVPSTDFNIGATTITYTVTDANVSTATATCSFTVTVEDEQPPVIACPASITQSSGAGTCTASVTVPLPLTVTDNCTASPTVTYALTGATTGSGAGAATGTYNVGVTIVTYTATDAAGNTAACQLTVTVVENILPTITCPSNLTRTVVADGTSNCTYTATTAEVSPTIGDNCTAVTVAANVSYIAFGATTAVGSGAATLNYNVGTTFVTYTVVDASGNTRQCTFSVVVTDNTAPVLVCPAPVTMNATSCSGFADVPPLGVTDNCGAGVVSTSFIIRNTNNLGNNNTIVRSGLGTNASGAFPVGVSTITFTSTDAAGNTASCSSTVTVNDVVPPIIVCPSSGDIIVNSSNDGTGDCETAVNIESVVAYDNCENVVITYVVQHFSTSSPATVVATVTGGNVGNFTSGGATWTSDPSASGDFSVGLNIVTYTATDRYGNTATCSIRVTVLDNENPTITCPANVQLPNATGTCGSPVTIPVPVTADNCGIRSVINNYNNTNNASDTYPVGLTTVIWTVTDINGNTATCGMFVRIDDNEVPNVICQNITIGVNSTSPTSITPSQVFNTNSTDNCGSVVPVSVSPNSFICPQNEGTNTVTLVVSDTRGNTASCQATVTVVCCVAEAGNVQLAQSPCPNQAISLSASGYMIDPGYSHWYIVTNSSGQIVWAQQAGATATIPVNTLPVGQNYCLYGYSVKTSTATSAPTGNISSIATWATCNDLSSPCRQFYVPNNPPALLGSSNISQGNQGGISPFYYNTNTVTVWGGTAPYQFTWDNTGYVRYDVFYGNVDHDNNPATPAIPGATITVFYADSASWAVTVTDSNACSTVNLPFGNIPSQVNTLLDIDSHTINSQTSTVSPNGSITLCVTGGPAGCVPTYSWSLPNGQTLTTSNTIGIPPCPLTSNSTNLPNLSYGWYSVTVTCGGESTQGWYWVPRQRRGRNKDDMQQAINISPNPFATVTEIKFAVEQSGMTRVAVYSVDGKEVALLFNEQADADETYTLSFDGSNLASGVYVVKVESESGTVETAKLMLTK